MIFFAIFGMVSSAGYMVVNKIDTWVVGTFVGLKSNGIYNIAAYIAGVLQIPMRAIVNISVPLVSKHWYENNYAELGILYRKASLNILLPGLLFFGAFGVSIDPFFAVIPNGKVLIAGKAVVIILGIAKLIDMGTGLNNHLLSYSKEYKLALISITILAGMTLGFNWLLVPKYGLVGVALATLISTTCYNLNSVFIIWYKYKLQPFSRKTVYAVGLAAALFLLIWLIPVVFNPYVMILLKSGLYCLLYGGIVLYSRISPDLNDLVSRLLEMGQKFIGK
jgi:O-antigen/teichoic acid export membrane protein